MRSLLWVGAAGTGTGVLAILYACSSSSSSPPPPAEGDDGGGSEATVDASGLPMPACVTSPTPAPFPTGNCDAPQPPQPDAVDQALAAVASSRCSLEMTWAESCFMPVTNADRLPDYTALLTAPLRLPGYGAETEKWLDGAVNGPTPVASAIAAAAVRLGTPVTHCPDTSWFTVDPTDAAPLASALEELAGFYQDKGFDLGAAQSAVAGVPLDMQQALVPVVRAIGYGAKDVEAARSPASSQYSALEQTPDMIIGFQVFDDTTAPFQFWPKVNAGAIELAATRIATAIEGAQLSRFSGRDLPATEIATAFGAIVIHGTGDDTYLPKQKADGAALLLDTGGDDTYRVAVGAGTVARAVSVSIDLGGSDLYGYVEMPIPADNAGHRLPSDSAGRDPSGLTLSRVPRQGAGLLGVGLLFDYGGADDTYRSLAISQGSGTLGVGVLFDDGGNDQYTAEALSQGAGAWGIGLLLDRAGSDKYVVYNSSQGFGFSKGFGGLVDEAGDDTYYADPGDPSLGGDAIYPNAQLPGPPSSTLKGNTSMAQGAGEGFRPDVPLAGHAFPGGMGVLRDASGSDMYTTSVFGQASAFAMGVGMLLEGGGDDTYEGLWYVQGSAAHSGITYFHEAAGNDRYNPTFPIQATSIGVGHDCSASVHYDESGNDVYHGPGLGLGCGNALGIGIFVNAGGSDTFVSPLPLAMGGASWDTYTNTPTTIGVFVKAGGPTQYQIVGVPADAGIGPYPGDTWGYAAHDGGALEKAVGVDRPDAGAVLP